MGPWLIGVHVKVNVRDMSMVIVRERLALGIRQSLVSVFRARVNVRGSVRVRTG